MRMTSPILDPVEFSQHATQKMRDRAVKRQDAIGAIDSPDSEYKDVESGARAALRTYCCLKFQSENVLHSRGARGIIVCQGNL